MKYRKVLVLLASDSMYQFSLLQTQNTKTPKPNLKLAIQFQLFIKLQKSNYKNIQ